MSDYNELVKALRCVSRYKNFTKDCNSQNPNEPCRYCNHWICEDDRIFADAAAAIEDLQATIELMKPFMPDFFPDANKVALPKMEVKE